MAAACLRGCWFPTRHIVHLLCSPVAAHKDARSSWDVWPDPPSPQDPKPLTVIPQGSPSLLCAGSMEAKHDPISMLNVKEYST